MPSRRPVIIAVLATVLLSACGEADEPQHSASDRTAGLSVTVSGDQVTLKRTSASASGTAGAAGQVYCTDDYDKLLTATAQPAPSLPWYAATLITWPDQAKATTATLSHALKAEPDICVAQTSDSSAQVVMYFNSKVKAAIDKQQTDSQREQQAAQPEEALKSAAQLVVSAAADGAFPAADGLVTAISGQGLYAKAAQTTADATETGTVYVVTSDTTTKQVVLALRGSDGKVTRATQKVKGDPKITPVGQD